MQRRCNGFGNEAAAVKFEGVALTWIVVNL